MRLCAVYALAGRTFAGDEVGDSVIVPIDPAGNVGDTKPFVAVYTDDQKDGVVTLTIEIGVLARMAVLRDGATQEEFVTGIPAIDDGIEALIDLLERQIDIAFADEENEWAALLKTVCSDLEKTGSTRGAMKTEAGERLAGRQVVFTGTPIKDPEFGAAIKDTSFWGKFLAKAEATETLVGFAAQMRALLTDGAATEDWRLVLRAMGFTCAAGKALGIVPPYGLDEMPTIGARAVEGRSIK